MLQEMTLEMELAAEGKTDKVMSEAELIVLVVIFTFIITIFFAKRASKKKKQDLE